MKYILLFFPIVAYAGQLEFDREVAKENAEHSYMLKTTCKKLPTKQEVDACIKEAKQHHADVLKGLRKHHLEK